ncbi:hypothetical protein [Xylophilus sp. GOD-11R]|uniref:hypothetical protein n=1 Tax=Xylophilus sp. GOD-11R TaxID=3089814 RepID=UPI00298BCCA8|nr:hypothetical protein [Xylophilus sp. GOD-11R]WPB55038.1 hypothetical protein R9X41_12745 [Xylophilus sp. GOD-11R]
MAEPPLSSFEHTQGWAPSRISDEALDRLYDLASPTRTSIYDRAWFIWTLVCIAVAGCGFGVYFVFVGMR